MYRLPQAGRFSIPGCLLRTANSQLRPGNPSLPSTISETLKRCTRSRGQGRGAAGCCCEFVPAISNVPLSTSQHGKTAFAGDHPLGPATLRPLCAGCWEQPAPSLLRRAGPQQLLVPGCRAQASAGDSDSPNL